MLPLLPDGLGSETEISCKATQSRTRTDVLLERLARMGLLSFICRLRAKEVYVPPTKTGAPTSLGLGQKEAEHEALSEQQRRHMEGGPDAETAQQVRSRPR